MYILGEAQRKLINVQLIKLNTKKTKRIIEDKEKRLGANNWGVFDAKVRERVGRANVHRGERRTQDPQQEPQIRAFECRARDRRGPRELSPLHPLTPPPLHPRIFSVGPVGALLQRRQGLRRPQAPGSRYQRLRLRRVVGLPTPPQQSGHG